MPGGPLGFKRLIRVGILQAESTKFVSYIPPTAVFKLLQHSGLGSNTGMGFHSRNDLHQCENGEAFNLDFWICFKNSMSSLKTD